MADFFWCLMASQRGHSIEDIADKLLEVSSKAQERARLHDEGYALYRAECHRGGRTGTQARQGVNLAHSISFEECSAVTHRNSP
jgi:hypothetical protein